MGALNRYREAELMHARWAMMGVTGCLTPEALSRFAGVDLGETTWWKAGSQIFGADGLEYGGLLHMKPAGMTGVFVLQVMAGSLY